MAGSHILVAPVMLAAPHLPGIPLWGEGNLDK